MPSGLFDELVAGGGDQLLPARRRGQGLEPVDVSDAVTWQSSQGRHVGVAVVRLNDDRDLVVPITRDSETWRRALPGDGVSAAVLTAPEPLRVEHFGSIAEGPAHVERDLDVDMSNDVVIVDEAVAVKWQLIAEPGHLGGPRLVAHLAAVGFDAMPRPVVTVTWNDRLIASATDYLPQARYGWDWMVDDLVTSIATDAPRPSGAYELGVVVARFHQACVTPSQVMLDPVAVAPDLSVLTEYYTQLVRRIPMLDAEMRSALVPWRDRFDAALQTLADARDVAVMPIHGDLHVGQIWRWPGGVAIGDFDGNPLLPAEHRGDRGPAAFDLACLLRSLDYVGHVAARRLSEGGATSDQTGAQPTAADSALEWSAEARSRLLGGYLDTLSSGRERVVLDEHLMAAFESLSPLHEAVYAATYLPRWRYVPLGVLARGW